MNILTKDYETSTFAKGNAHSRKGKAICVGTKWGNASTECRFNSLEKEKPCDLLVGFNVKFELCWDKRLGIPMPQQIHCVQLAEYMLDRQKPYPSLEETAKKYGLSSKLDVVKLEYWDKGIDTEDVPKPILSEYCIQDVDLTYEIYNLQLQQFKERPALYKLFKLACQDLLTLVEMEWNGLQYNEELCKERVKDCQQIKWKTILELEKGIFA